MVETLVTKIVSLVLPLNLDYGGERKNNDESGGALPSVWDPVRVDG